MKKPLGKSMKIGILALGILLVFSAITVFYTVNRLDYTAVFGKREISSVTFAKTTAQDKAELQKAPEKLVSNMKAELHKSKFQKLLYSYEGTDEPMYQLTITFEDATSIQMTKFERMLRFDSTDYYISWEAAKALDELYYAAQKNDEN